MENYSHHHDNGNVLNRTSMDISNDEHRHAGRKIERTGWYK